MAGQDSDVVEAVGRGVTHVKPGDRVTVNVETFCRECVI